MGLSADRPLAAVRDAITIVREMLKGEEVNYAGGVLRAQGQAGVPAAAAGYAAPDGGQGRAGACVVRNDRRRADISNMPSGFTRQALDVVRKAAHAAHRPAPAEVVQYVPCAVRATARKRTP